MKNEMKVVKSVKNGKYVIATDGKEFYLFEAWCVKGGRVPQDLAVSCWKHVARTLQKMEAAIVDLLFWE